MFFFLWGKKSGHKIVDHGYLDCPSCRERQPAVLMRYVQSSHVYFIPLGRTEGPEQVQCKVCAGVFPNDMRCAFGHDEKPPDWNCFKCMKPIPYMEVECPHCGFRFTA